MPGFSSFVAHGLRRILKRENLQGWPVPDGCMTCYQRLRPSGLYAAGRHLTGRVCLAFPLA